MYRKFLVIALLYAVCPAEFPARGQQPDAPSLIADVVSFRGETDTAVRADVYLGVPYSSLQFVQISGGYAAEYSAVITVRDAAGRKFAQKNFGQRCTTPDYETTRGASGAADYTQTVFALPKGQYSIEAAVTDALAKRELRATLTLSAALNWRTQLIGISGLLLVSSIEERGGRYSITPYLSTNIGRLTEPFFAFFETYNNTSDITEADFLWELIDAKGAVALRGPAVRRKLGAETGRHYVSVPAAKNLAAGKYTFRVLVINPADSASGGKASSRRNDVLASAEKSVVIERGLAEASGKELDKLVGRLLYAATQAEIDLIEQAGAPEEKKRLFDEFWQRLDPTPNSVQNEAFDEYYARIEQANQRFRSAREGWLTDMGAVYVIFGPPVSTDRSPAVSASGRSIVRWTMAGGRQFAFVDDMGFGDYRLTTPLPAGEKYRYGR